MPERNVLGGQLEPCGSEPPPGFCRDGCCSSGPEDLGLHTICAVVTAEFLEHQRMIGNDLSTPMPQFRFPGLVPGDRGCVTAGNWLLAYRDGFAAPVGLASTHERSLEVVPLEALQENAVDVPDDLGGLSRHQHRVKLPELDRISVLAGQGGSRAIAVRCSAAPRSIRR